MLQEQSAAASEPIAKRCTLWGAHLGFQASLTFTKPTMFTARQVATMPFWQPTPVAAGGPDYKCPIIPDLVKQPHEWVQAYSRKMMEEPPSWWPEFLSLYQGCTRRLCETTVQEHAKRQTASFRLPAAQDEKLGWWNPPPSISDLGYQDFLPHGYFQGMGDVWEMKKEQNLVLAKALQCCTEWAGETSIMMWGMAQDLQMCTANLMEFKKDNVLEILSLTLWTTCPLCPLPLQRNLLSLKIPKHPKWLLYAHADMESRLPSQKVQLNWMR